MRLFVAVFLFMIVCQFAGAQAPVSASVVVKITDEKSKGFEGANVALCNARDSSLIKINITQKNGAVLFKQVRAGRYLLSVSSVGYKKAWSPLFVVGQEGKQVTLPDIHLDPATGQLREVNIQEKKPYIERLPDRLVVNVGSSIVSTGSTALEVLSRSPGVLVNQNDDISMKGKQGVIVMIDGKPTNLSSTDRANMLRAMSSNAIDKIELITNPSAKFDAAGSAGIINIKLKKDQRYGANGTLTLSSGQGAYNRQNAGLNLNYRNNKVNLFGNYNYSYRMDDINLNLFRQFYTNGQLNGGYSQDNYLKLPLRSNFAKVGIDYSPSKNTTIGVVFTGFASHFFPTGYNNSTVLDSLQQKVSYFGTYSIVSNRPSNYTGNFNFKHTIDTAGQEITGDVDYARFMVNPNQYYRTNYYNLDGSTSTPDGILTDRQPGFLNIYSVKADYTLPLKKQARFEAGFKSSLVKADNNVSFYNVYNGVSVFDTAKSNHFIYQENINAAYLNYSKTISKYKIQVGLRAEQTIANGDQITTDNSFRNSYVQFFPKAFVSNKIDEQNDFTLSVGRRIDRPTYRQLNPFKFFLDPTTTIQGNPYLRPQLTWSSELNYTWKQKYIITLSYSNTSDNITSVLYPNSKNGRVSIQSDVNLASAYNYGLSFTVPVEVTSWWSSSNNLNTYYNGFSGNLANTPLNKAVFAFDASSNNSFTIAKGTTAELDGVFNSGNVYGYLYVNRVLVVSGGIQHTILKGKGTIKLNIADALKTNKLIGTTSIDNYTEVFKRSTDSRFATLAFTYRFGNNKVAPSRRRAGGAEEEKKRAT